jgi:hypothetical protein
MAYSDEELFAIAARAAKAFAHLPNVHSVGVGGRERGGRPTGEIVLKVFVRQKLPSDRLDRRGTIPESFEGVPTDVVPAAIPEKLALVPGIELLTADQYDAMEDQSRERPLVGGTMIEPDDESGAGTLGFIVEALEDNRMVFAVTNYHVVFDNRALERPAEVGQPTPSHSCTACCRGVIGKFFGGFHAGAVAPAPFPRALDYALIRLDAGLEWKNEVKEIGVLEDTYNLKVSDIVMHTYQVRKRGFVTHLTGGIVHAIGIARPPDPVIPPGATDAEIDAIFAEQFFQESIAIRPNAIPASPGATVLFATHGDSGSALVNDANQVVGLLWGGRGRHSSPDPALDRIGYGWGVPIKWIEDDIKQRLSITMRILPTAGEGIVNTVPEFAEARPTLRAETSLERDLDQTERGREFLRAWLRHSDELNAIVQNQRRVATVWQRHNGAALLRMVARAPLEPTRRLPIEVDGVPVGEGLKFFLDQIDRYASDHLKRDLSRHRPLLLSLPGRSYQDVLGQLHRENLRQ